MPIAASNLYAIAAALLAAGCRCSDGASSSAASSPAASAGPAAPSASATGGPAPVCKARVGQFSLSPTDGRTVPKADDSDEQDLDLPFSVELGEAIRHQSGFAVTGLRAAQSGNQAVLALLPEGLQPARVLELGAVHGDVAPPRVVASGDNLIVAVTDADASGQSIRLALVQPDHPDSAQQVRWGASVHDGEDDSQAVALASSGSRAILVWDDWDKSANHGVVKLAVTSVQDVSALSATKVVSSPGTDAESPRIAAAVDGFWVAWVVNDERPGPRAKEPAGSAVGPGGALGGPSEPGVEERTLEAAQRGIALLRLDAQGVARGAARRVTPPGMRVTQFDLASDSGGAAYVAWRAGASSLASEGGELGLLVISETGEENRLPLAEIESGGGVPQLLFDGGTTNRGVLAIAQPGDETALLWIGPGGASAASPLPAALGAAVPVALAGQDLLLVRPLGRALVFTNAACR